MNPKKKILIVSRSFYPQNSPRSFRATELAKELARQGHRVKVITPYHPEQEILIEKYGFEVKDLGKVKWGKFELKGNRITVLLKRAINRFSNLLFQYPNVELIPMVERALKEEKDYDLLISIAVPHAVHWGVAKAWRKDLAKYWVADCGDPFMGQENDTFKAPFYFQFVEKWWSKKAHFISVPTEGAIGAYYSEFHHKIKVIPQGFDFKEIDLPEYVPNQIPTFAYAGALIPGVRDPKPLVEYLESKNTSYKFIIYSGTDNMVKPLVKLTKGRVEWRSPIPRAELLPILGKMDFLINFENLGSKQTPSKLIDYGIVQRPILSISPSGINVKLVDEFLNKNYNNELPLENLERYKIENVAKAFLNLAS